jgi:hypothetical protein
MSYFTAEYMWTVPGALLAVAAITSAVILLFRRTYADLTVWESAAIFFALALLGVVTGYLTGLSRSSAVGAVIPAVLTLIGGLVLYLVTGDAPRARRMLTAASVVALMTNLLVGTLWGSLSRADPTTQGANLENDETLREAICYKRLAFEIEVRETRAREGLPDVNSSLLVPGCTPPFADTVFAPAD